MIWSHITDILLIIDVSVLIGQAVGALFAFFIGIALVKYEYNRVQDHQKENWQRQVHGVCLSLRAHPYSDASFGSEKNLYDIAQRYEVYSDRLADLMHDSRNDLGRLLSPMENTIMYSNAFAYQYHHNNKNQDERDNNENLDRETLLKERNKDLRLWAGVVQYIVEQDNDIEFERTLASESPKEEQLQVVEKYESWKAGEPQSVQEQRVEWAAKDRN